MSLYGSASYHHISPLTRTRSRSLSTSYAATALRRASSYTSTTSGGFTKPSYGYGSGFMGRSMNRGGSTMFGRSLSATALDRTPPFSNIGVQRSTPHYSDKYPYVRYSYGNTDTALHTLTQTELKSNNYDRIGIRDTGTKRWLEGRVNLYNTTLFTRPETNKRVERPIAPVRSYVRYMGQDDAVDLFKNKYMTASTLSKYWLSPTTAYSRRQRDLNIGSKTFTSNYNSYSTRFADRSPYYSRVANKLY
ncbi:hypothetical protein M3Y97_00154000 [Aphelenchoides bicaudatus]|nr:hypothetical protein M3Y97_00154000 [Aphelenchoides bicaudatus]